MKANHLIRQLLSVVAFLILISSCSITTKNQSKGLHDIEDFFGGECSLTVGYSISSNDGTNNKIEIQIKKSDVIEKYANIAEMCASNAAYIFYTDLDDERKEVKEINVTLNFNDGNSFVRRYRSVTLDTIIANMHIEAKVVDFLMQRNYDSVAAMFDTSIVKINRDTFAMSFKTIDSTIGLIDNYQPFGFFITKSRIDGAQIIHMACTLKGDKRNSQFSIEFEPALKSNNVLYYSFNY